ncbi:MAG: hypothetical protein ACKOW3_01095 [Hyphomicrobium sp.]
MITPSSKLSRNIRYSVLLVAFYMTGSNEAFSLDMRVKMACAADYFAHCSAYSPSSPEVRKCMRSVGRNLSQGCINALRNAGEISTKPTRSEIITASN